MSFTPQSAIPCDATKVTWLRAQWVWGILVTLLALNLPLFLCQHLTSDAVIYDLQARCALEGGVLYRDIVEPNLPGVVWIHMLVRSLWGWSTVALRSFDLLMVTAVTLLLARWVKRPNELLWGTRIAVFSLAVFGLYLSLTEWCHCQRDFWMLAPCLGALELRRQRIDPLRETNHKIVGGWNVLSLVEGLLWGAAFWIKPHVAIPVSCVLLASLLLTGVTRRSLCDLAFVFCGGALAGCAGSAWLIGTGAWPHFWEMQLDWNPEYVRAARRKMSLERLLRLWQVFLPWSWAQIPAVIGAVVLFRQAIRNSRRKASAPAADEPRVLLAALFLGWMMQALMLQHPFMYMYLPGVVLAVALVASWEVRPEFQKLGWYGLAACAASAILVSPAVQPTRLANWWDCVTKGPTSEIRARIQIEDEPVWKDLAPVLEYLRQQQLSDGELLVYTRGMIVLYPELGLRPPNRYVFLDVLSRLFRGRAAEMQEALERCPQRYVVSGLCEAGMDPERIDGPSDPETLLPLGFTEKQFSQFPYTQPVVFRSGEYLVHRVQGPLGPLCTEYFPLAQQDAAGQ